MHLRPTYHLHQYSHCTPLAAPLALVVDSGHTTTHATPIYEGFAVKKACNRLDLGGRDVAVTLQKLLVSEGGRVNDLDTTRQIKEQLCFLAADLDLEHQKPATEIEKSFALPDGNEILVGRARYEAPEILFKPELYSDLEPSTDGLHKAVVASIEGSDTDLRVALSSNIILVLVFRFCGYKILDDISSLA